MEGGEVPELAARVSTPATRYAAALSYMPAANPVGDGT